MASTPGTAEDVAAAASYWLARYREDPPPFLLLKVTERLCAAEAPEAAAEAAGISGEWLREQGELAAAMSVQDVRDAGGLAARDLRRLRRLLSLLDVSCAGWTVSDNDIAGAPLRYAQKLYRNAVRHMSPYDGWELLRFWAEGCVPSLDAVAPGASGVVIGYAVRYVQEEVAGEDGDLAAFILGQLRAMLTALDPAGRTDRTQVYRLVTEKPKRMDISMMLALCDILGCQLTDRPVPAAKGSPASDPASNEQKG